MLGIIFKNKIIREEEDKVCEMGIYMCGCKDANAMIQQSVQAKSSLLIDIFICNK